MQDDYAQDFGSQRFCPLRSGDNAVALLKANKSIFLRMARNIALGAGDFEWNVLQSKFLPQMQRCGWMIQEPVMLMRAGLRDLQTLTRGLDRGTSTVLEAILLKVLQVEKEERLNKNKGKTLAPVPLKRQLSIGTSARNVMSQLQGKVSMAVYHRVLKFLVKTLTYIRGDPSNLMYRRLKKSSQLMSLHVLPSVEAMSVLRDVGFVDGSASSTGSSGVGGAADEDVLVMPVVEIDKVARLLQVLQEEAKDVGLDI